MNRHIYPGTYTRLPHHSIFLLLNKRNEILKLLFYHFEHHFPRKTLTAHRLFCFFFFSRFGLWIQLQVTHLTHSSSFWHKHILFKKFTWYFHKWISSKNLKTKINASFIIEVHHILENFPIFFSFIRLIWTYI